MEESSRGRLSLLWQLLREAHHQIYTQNSQTAPNDFTVSGPSITMVGCGKRLIVCCQGCLWNCPWNVPFINLCSISTASTKCKMMLKFSQSLRFCCCAITRAAVTGLSMSACCAVCFFFKLLYKRSKRLHVASCCKHTFGAKLWLFSTCQNWSRVLLNNLDLNEVLYKPLSFRSQTTASCSP